MDNSLQIIPLSRLLLAFLPVVVVVVVLFRWSLGAGTALYALARMLIQLLLIGYVLTFIFESERSLVVLGVLTIMLALASWIALHPLQRKDRRQYGRALASIALGGGFTLILITQGVLDLQPWFDPSKVIPLAGMIFANAMTAISLAADRFYAELPQTTYAAARAAAFRAALIPITNALFAVGLVSLPGMMTGQILSGVDPLVAARYQIMVMCMVYGSAGISVACYLALLQTDVVEATDSAER